MAAGDLTFPSATRGQLATGDNILYTVPAGQTVIHFDLWLCNTDATTAYRADIHIASSGAASAANQIINQESGVSDMRAGESRTHSADIFVGAGELFRGAANVSAKITYFLSVVLRADS